MATIFLRGIGQKEVSNHDAKIIKQQWENGTLKHDEIISFGNFACKAGSITGITLEPETKDDNHNEEVEQDYYRNRNRILTSSLDERASKVEFYKLFIKIMDDRDTTDDEIEQVKKIQRDFFEKNPYRTICDPQLYKQFTNKQKAMIGKAMHIIERVVQTDITYQKYKLCTPKV